MARVVVSHVEVVDVDEFVDVGVASVVAVVRAIRLVDRWHLRA